MQFWSELGTGLVEHWSLWALSAVLIVAAVIDGWALKVPNWITFPLVVAGWIYSFAMFGWEGLGWSLLGTVVGLALLLPAYSIGGMGAGDVKLLAGIGAWVHVTHTFNAFCVSAVIGAVLAVLIVVLKGTWRKHAAQFQFILAEIIAVKNPEKLSEIAAERKPRMQLLPYGIPITIGTIGYFFYMGMMF